MCAASYARADPKRYASFVAGVVQHHQKIHVHDIDTKALRIGAAFPALAIKFLEAKIS
jgi:stage V sporulation protein SpoVS